MKFQYTKYGFINALWSLIPIFPIWTIFPGVLAATAIENTVGGCETGYLAVLWGSVFFAIVCSAYMFFKVGKYDSQDEKEVKINFRLWSLLVYTLINTSGLILFVGVDSVCHGDGQTFLACIYSGPIASLSIFALGIICDLKTISLN